MARRGSVDWLPPLLCAGFSQQSIQILILVSYTSFKIHLYPRAKSIAGRWLQLFKIVMILHLIDSGFGRCTKNPSPEKPLSYISGGLVSLAATRLLYPCDYGSLTAYCRFLLVLDRTRDIKNRLASVTRSASLTVGLLCSFANVG
eukprot:6206464-Pleurochrysis_carterae.AAC.3